MEINLMKSARLSGRNETSHSSNMINSTPPDGVFLDILAEVFLLSLDFLRDTAWLYGMGPKTKARRLTLAAM